MNEHIKKLAVESGFFFHDAGYAPTEHTHPLEYSEMCFKRLHDKIVKECAEFTDPVTRNLMMKHFGIEK